MRKRYKPNIFPLLLFFLGCFLVSVFSCSVLMSSTASALDELYLTGIVKSIDMKSGTIVVNVISQNCPGARRFSVANAPALQGLQDEKVSFSINSSACKGSEIYRIITIKREG
ncbi:MAG TPA: hypothetical protein VEI28_04025 [Thermodesulfovibrionales bacterium]|nr:hypothetical protein [Thermodesulfovibrionales bacterium]